MERSRGRIRRRDAAMSMAVTARAVARTTSLDALITRMNAAAIQAVIESFARLIADETRQNAPEKTGADKASVAESVTVTLTELAAEISIGKGLPDNYGALQELGFHHAGTGQFIQNPALIPAFLAHRDEFVAAIRALITGG